jgi:hypothetical protein
MKTSLNIPLPPSTETYSVILHIPKAGRKGTLLQGRIIARRVEEEGRDISFTFVSGESLFSVFFRSKIRKNHDAPSITWEKRIQGHVMLGAS